MRPLKPDQLRRMSIAELQKELDKTCATSSIGSACNKPSGNSRIPTRCAQLKRNIARITTIINEKRREAGV
jgi:ribosomal protein L29